MTARASLILPFLLTTLSPILPSSGYDAYTACSKPFRTSKFYAEPPCDFRYQSWCTIPGSAYPWQAVRRFVRENQGLMRRMYGDERHISVLRAEIQSNDVEYLTEREWKLREEVRMRYSSRIPQKIVSETISRKEPVMTTTSESTPNPQTTLPPTTLPSSTPFNTTQVPFSTSHLTPYSNLSDYSEETTTAYESPNATLAVTTATTMPVETTATEGESNSTEQLDTETAYETTEQEQVTEQMTTVKENELFQEEPVQVVEKSPPLVKLKGVNACPVKEEVVAPFWANNTRGEVLALLNVYPFEQYVHWEKCTYENKQMFCRDGCRCEQQYRLHRLLAYDPSNECRGIFSDWFKFPSCCVCRCYDLPIAFHITSRSPRTNSNDPPYWYRDKLKSVL